MATTWAGKIKGHIGEAKDRAATDAAQRRAAGEGERSIILSKLEVQGEWDASRTLVTTLGGTTRPITTDDLAQFRQNMRTAQKNFKGASGITARQVIDLASTRPLGYANPDSGSDIAKARKEITMAHAVSASGANVRFITNAAGSDVSRHHVMVRFNGYAEAAVKLMATDSKSQKDPKQAANWLRKQRLAYDCDCGRHRFFFRYVTTIGNFNAGRDELGYPKIRNPGLKGVACKHVLRVMSEIESSGSVWGFLTKHMEKLKSSSDNTARTQAKQKEFDQEALKAGRTREIKTSDQRAKDRQKIKDKAALHSAVKAAPRPVKKPVSTRKIESALASGKLTVADLATMRDFGFSDVEIAAKIKKG